MPNNASKTMIALGNEVYLSVILPDVDRRSNMDLHSW